MNSARVTLRTMCSTSVTGDARSPEALAYAHLPCVRHSSKTPCWSDRWCLVAQELWESLLAAERCPT
jgi:hypothetical protein